MKKSKLIQNSLAVLVVLSQAAPVFADEDCSIQIINCLSSENSGGFAGFTQRSEKIGFGRSGLTYASFISLPSATGRFPGVEIRGTSSELKQFNSLKVNFDVPEIEDKFLATAKIKLCFSDLQKNQFSVEYVLTELKSKITNIPNSDWTQFSFDSDFVASKDSRVRNATLLGFQILLINGPSATGYFNVGRIEVTNAGRTIVTIYDILMNKLDCGDRNRCVVSPEQNASFARRRADLRQAAAKNKPRGRGGN
jgi:hypothetical protein